MQKLSSKIFLSVVMFSLLFSSLSVSADSDNKGKSKAEKNEARIEKRIQKESEKQEKREERERKKENKRLANNEETKCLVSWGRLIAFGWLKKNPTLEVNLDNCAIPFGIKKKLSNNSGDTPDTVAPVISNIRSFSGTNRAIVSWETNEKTNGKLYYSTTSPVNIGTSPSIDGRNGLKSKSHFAAISGLATSTTYYFIVEAQDTAGNTTLSNQASFTTKIGTTTLDATSPIISATSTTVATSSITVNWQTNEVATSKVYYSTTTPINTSLAHFVSSGTLLLNHVIKIEGLSTSTPYYLLIESMDASANMATSTQFATTTLAE